MRNATALALAVVAGLAFASPAIARPATPSVADSLGIPCPAMPPVADTVESKGGSIGLQLPAFGLSGNRSRGSSTSDVAMRAGGIEGFSTLVTMAQVCEANRRLYPGDHARQRNEMIKLRESLFRREAPVVDQKREDRLINAFTSGAGPCQTCGPTAPVPANASANTALNEALRNVQMPESQSAELPPVLPQPVKQQSVKPAPPTPTPTTIGFGKTQIANTTTFGTYQDDNATQPASGNSVHCLQGNGVMTCQSSDNSTSSPVIYSNQCLPGHNGAPFNMPQVRFNGIMISPSCMSSSGGFVSARGWGGWP